MKGNRENQVWKTLEEMEVNEMFYAHHSFPLKYIGFSNNRHYYMEYNMAFEIGVNEYEKGEKYLIHNEMETRAMMNALNKNNNGSKYGVKVLQKQLKEALAKEDFEYAEILKNSIESLKSVRQ